MSSSQPFLNSSPIAGHGIKKRSQFNYKQLAQLASFSTTSPLRIIAHIDLDAFYAQCEMVRLDVPEDQPLAVQQWQGLIAINYPARKFGLNRHVTITEAKKLCPSIITQHVATWREGDEKWAYHKDAFAHIGTHKVSLDPYRLQSRRILACIKDFLPQQLQKVEKASIDEVFLDMSAQIHSILLERYPELALPPPYDDPTEQLPLPPTSALDWRADALIDLDQEETEHDDPDWDDIAMLIGSEIVRGVRAEIREKLHYTCSAGIAHNKMLAKLGSAHKKPNSQTVIRNRAVQQFLSDFKFTKIRNLGGKLGEQIVSTFTTDTVKDLLPISVEQLKQKLGDDTGTWVFQAIRGVDHSEVNSRTQIKSMLSAKSFRPSINTFEQAVRWIRIFVADIFSRLIEEGVLENKRRPKTIILHYRQGGITRSRGGPIPQGKTIDEPGLFELGKSLLQQIIAEGQVWPCANLSLSVGGFEDGVSGNMGIGAFLVKGEDAKALKLSTRDPDLQEPAAKRLRPDFGSQGLHRFLTKTDSIEEHDEDFGAQAPAEDPLDISEISAPVDITPPDESAARPHVIAVSKFTCKRCNTTVETEAALQDHNDWHFAKDLQNEDRIQHTVPAASVRQTLPSSSKKKTPTLKNKSVAANTAKSEKGQSKLSFG